MKSKEGPAPTNAGRLTPIQVLEELVVHLLGLPSIPLFGLDHSAIAQHNVDIAAAGGSGYGFLESGDLFDADDSERDNVAGRSR